MRIWFWGEKKEENFMHFAFYTCVCVCVCAFQKKKKRNSFGLTLFSYVFLKLGDMMENWMHGCYMLSGYVVGVGFRCLSSIMDSLDNLIDFGWDVECLSED